MLLQFLFVLTAIIIGARLKGVGLGVMGGLGLAILVFGFGLQPTSPPIDVILIIASVISAAGAMQAAGGLNLMVSLAEDLLRRHPSRITILSPMVTYLFTLVSGTSHVSYSVLPVIAEVARETNIRPERPLSIAVIASQQAITASPISPGMVAILTLLSGFGITLVDVMSICVPSTIVGVALGTLVSMRMGKNLDQDPEYLQRVKDGVFANDKMATEKERPKLKSKAGLSVLIFLLSTVAIVMFALFPSLRQIGGAPLSTPVVTEILMLTSAALILLLTKTSGVKASSGTVFISGMQAVIAIFGIAWMGDTFINANIVQLKDSIQGVVLDMPWIFVFALFGLSTLMYSQAATIRSLLPLGIALSISPWVLVALFPAVNGMFFLPNYPTVVAAIGFDRTGTTHVGKWVLNHSFMLPGLVSTFGAVATGLLLVYLLGK